MPGSTPRPGDARGLVGALVEQLHADADAEERPARGDGVVGRAPRARLARTASMHAPKAPTPGSTTPAASAISAGSAVRRASAPTRSSAFCADRRLPMP